MKYNREQWNNDISIPVLVNFHIDTFDLDFQHRFQPLKQHEITWGIGYRLIVDSDAFINYDPGSRNIQLYSAFVQDEITLITDFWRLIIGSEFEHNDYTGFEIQPTLRSIWNWSDKHTLRAAISRATRTPSKTERDGTFQHRHIPSLVFKHSSAEDLRSEQMIAYELGYHWQVNKQLNFDLAAYYNGYRRLIESIIVKIPHINEKIAYVGEATVWDFELAMDWRPLEALLIQAHYSYLDDQSSVKQISSNNQTAPHHQVLFSAGVDITQQLQLNLTGRYVDGISDHNIDGYYGFDVHLAWQPVAGVELAVVGRNLLDDQHPEFNERQIETVPTQVFMASLLGVLIVGQYYLIKMRLLAKTAIKFALMTYSRVKAPVTRRSPHRPGGEDFPHPVPRFSSISERETHQATPRWCITPLDSMHYSWLGKRESFV